MWYSGSFGRVGRLISGPQKERKKEPYSGLRAFAAFCGRFVGTSARENRVLVVLGFRRLDENRIEIEEKQVKEENYQEFMENEFPGSFPLISPLNYLRFAIILFMPHSCPFHVLFMSPSCPFHFPLMSHSFFLHLPFVSLSFAINVPSFPLHRPCISPCIRLTCDGGGRAVLQVWFELVWPNIQTTGLQTTS